MKKTKLPGILSSKDDEGVSPVVGVMLMLVVTIIIAAIVASFASGLGTASSTLPVASLSVTMFAGNSDKHVMIEHLGGDNLPTKDLMIVSSFTVPEKFGTSNVKAENRGRVIKHTIDGSLAPISENGFDVYEGGFDPFTPQVTNDDNIVSTRTADQTFGTAVLVPGGRLTFDRDYFLGFDTSKRTTYGFAEGSVVHVSIIHKESGKILYDNDLVIPW